MGPLKGVRIIEMAGIGPGPFAGMLLADMGAEVVQVERRAMDFVIPDANRRGKKSIALNLKDEKDIETLLQLVEKADVLFEGFRPGVMERLGIGPDVCLDRNPKLIYGRMTGWGQTGPLANAAGHDINYIALTGALHAMGRRDSPPAPPLNLVGDYGGGAMFLVMGILAAYIEAQTSGKGQVIDVAMTEGTANLFSIFGMLDKVGMWKNTRGSNLLDSGAPFYDCYETKDGKYISIGSIEPQFYQIWPDQKAKITEIFKSKTRDEWCVIMEGTDVCFAPVLNYKEAPSHPQNVERKAYFELDGLTQPSPAPRFSRTPSEVRHGSRPAGGDMESVLEEWLNS